MDIVEWVCILVLCWVAYTTILFRLVDIEKELEKIRKLLKKKVK